MSRALMTMTVVLLLGLAGTVGAQTAKPAAEGPAEKTGDFSFYGVHFRMTRQQVRSVMRTNEDATEAVKPGRGMMFLTFAYDSRDRLIEIRASYPRPEDPLAEEGLRKALRERWMNPIAAKYRNLALALDEHSNRAAITLQIVSLDLREEAVNSFRDEFLKGFDQAP